MYVARSGREVDEQVVESFPEGLVKQLFECRGRHGAAPDEGVVGRDEEADRGDLDASRLGRQNVLLSVADERLRGVVFHAEHFRHGGSVDVGVEYSDAVSHIAQRNGEVGGDGRFADSAFARRDGYGVPDARRGGDLLFGRGCRSLLSFRYDHLSGQLGKRLRNGCRYLSFDGVGERVAPLAECERDDRSVCLHCDMLDHTRGDDILSRFRMHDSRENRSYVLFVFSHGDWFYFNNDTKIGNIFAEHRRRIFRKSEMDSESRRAVEGR